MSTAGTKTARVAPGTVEPIIFQKPHQVDRKRVFVNPPIFHIGQGKSPTPIRLENKTGDVVKIWLPNAEKYLDLKPGDDFSKPIEVAKGGHFDITVKADPERGHYQYHVYCEAIKDFAEGNSPPALHCP
jgi:hypothetical protein